MITRSLRWLWRTDVTSWPVRAFNWLYFETFGYEEHFQAQLALKTAERHRLNVTLYADTSAAVEGLDAASNLLKEA